MIFIWIIHPSWNLCLYGSYMFVCCSINILERLTGSDHSNTYKSFLFESKTLNFERVETVTEDAGSCSSSKLLNQLKGKNRTSENRLQQDIWSNNTSITGQHDRWVIKMGINNTETLQSWALSVCLANMDIGLNTLTERERERESALCLFFIW